MSGQWRPLGSVGQQAKRGGAVFNQQQQPAGQDRYRQISSQEQLIEQKKLEIERKAMDKRRQEQLAAESGDATAAKNLAARSDCVTL